MSLLLRSLLLGLTVSACDVARAAGPDEYVRQPDLLLKAACPSDSLLLQKTFFTICYQTQWRIPRWVAYFLTAADLEGDVPRSSNFREDPDIPPPFRSKNSDYEHSGYAKGHQAPAEDFDRSVIAMKTTFIYSNAAPQTPQLNSGKWRSLEDQARNVASAHRGVWIFPGSLFAAEDRKPSEVLGSLAAIDPMKRSRSSTSQQTSRQTDPVCSVSRAPRTLARSYLPSDTS